MHMRTTATKTTPIAIPSVYWRILKLLNFRYSPARLRMLLQAKCSVQGHGDTDEMLKFDPDSVRKMPLMAVRVKMFFWKSCHFG